MNPTLVLITALALSMPPLPQTATPTTKLLSPKHAELSASWGKPLVKTAVVSPVPAFVPTGFVITNISLGTGTVTLQWQQGQPLFQVQSKTDIAGAWTNMGGLTTAHTRQFTATAPQSFFRISQSNSLPLSITHTNPNTINWTIPDLDMSDSISKFTAWKKQGPQDTGDPSNPANNWALLQDNISPSTTQLTDGTTPPVNYGLRGYTANGVVIPYGDQWLTTALSGTPVWLKPIIATAAIGNGQLEYKSSVVDSQNNIVVAGQFIGTIGFGTKSDGSSVSLTSSGTGGFVAKYKDDGTLIFATVIYTSVSAGAGFLGVCLDSHSNIIISGFFQGTIVFPGGTTFTSIPDQFNQLHNDILLAKCGPDGSFIWAKQYGNGYEDLGGAVVCDASDNIVMACSISPLLGAGVTFGSHTLVPEIAQSLAIVSISPDGNTCNWANYFPGTDTNDDPSSVYTPIGICFDKTGSVVVAAGCRSGLNAGKGPIVFPGHVDGNFIAKYSAGTGACSWVVSFGGGGAGAGIFGVAVDNSGGASNGDLAVCGTITSDVAFDGVNSVQQGIFVAVYKPDGSFYRVQGINRAGTYSIGGDVGMNVAISSTGNIYISGRISSSVLSFDGQHGWFRGGCWIAKYDPALNLQWGYTNGATTNPNDLSPSSARVVCVGSTHVTIAGQLLYKISWPKNYDAVPPPPTPSPISISPLPQGPDYYMFQLTL